MIWLIRQAPSGHKSTKHYTTIKPTILYNNIDYLTLSITLLISKCIKNPKGTIKHSSHILVTSTLT